MYCRVHVNLMTSIFFLKFLRKFLRKFLLIQTLFSLIILDNWRSTVLCTIAYPPRHYQAFGLSDNPALQNFINENVNDY